MSHPPVEQQQQHLEWLEIAHLFKLCNTTLRPHQTTRPTIKTKTSSSGNITTSLICLKNCKTRCREREGWETQATEGNHLTHVWGMTWTTSVTEGSYNDNRTFCRCKWHYRKCWRFSVECHTFLLLFDVHYGEKELRENWKSDNIKENARFKVGSKCGQLALFSSPTA